MKYFFWLILILQWQVSISQQCDCRENFLYMKDKVKKNYVGFTYKVPLSLKYQFDHFTDSLENLTSPASQGKCLQLMRAWLGYFKDLHTSITIKNDTANNDIVRQMFSTTEKINFTEQTFRTYLDSNKNGLDPLEGIWEESYLHYKIGFVRDSHDKPDQFIGFIIKADGAYWIPGQIKARVRKNGSQYDALYFLTRDHSAFKPSIVLQQNELMTGIFGNWHRKFPESNDTNAPVFENTLRTPTFSILDDRNCLLTIPGSDMNDKRIVDSLVNTNASVIQQRENLIIDMRNNMGGSVLTFQQLLPLLYTGPIINKGASVLATDDNIRFYYSQYDIPNISDSMKNVFRKEEATLKRHEGSLYELWPDDTIRFDKRLAYPRRVSIIINEYCASSAELFLLQARQSNKVVIYGKHSMGAVDYSDAVTMQMPCNLFSLRYATSRSNRLPAVPLDNIGIQPDIEIPDNTVNWIEFIRSKNNSR